MNHWRNPWEGQGQRGAPWVLVPEIQSTVKVPRPRSPSPLHHHRVVYSVATCGVRGLECQSRDRDRVPTSSGVTRGRRGRVP